jgi:hypothetical protein
MAGGIGHQSSLPMSSSPCSARAAFGLLAVLSLTISHPTLSQTRGRARTGNDTTVVPSRHYSAGPLHRYMLGDGYRDLWSTPIKVPLLDLKKFAGGIKATKTGGGAQTKNLRFEARDGREWVFRPVYKALLLDLDAIEGTVIMDIFADALSSSHPTAPLVAPKFLEAAGVPHPTPALFIMPDDPALGEFRAEFKGKLGTLEDYPSVPDDAPGFAGASNIEDTEEILKRLNAETDHRVDARTLLAARLVDFLLGDNDRHRDQWKWARIGEAKPAVWVPIPRDRDKVFVHHDGLVLDLARFIKPNLVTFGAKYPPVEALAGNKVLDFDARLLGTLDKADWDSVAAKLQGSITNSVIDAALASAPRELHRKNPDLAAKLRARRDALPALANDYYRVLAAWPEVHGTDKADRATITRATDGSVEVKIQDGDDAPYFERRFRPEETREIRVYLHGGDDRATVTGDAGKALLVRVIGGEGNNTLVDSSTVAGARHGTRLYDVGVVSGLEYKPDTAFNRRPWIDAYGTKVPPQREDGVVWKPTFSVKTGRGLGIVPQVGARRTEYGFRTMPYKSQMELEVAYSSSIGGFEVELETDHRFESSRLHLLTESAFSELEVGRFLGFGNDMPFQTSDISAVRSTAWIFRPAAGFALGPKSDISLGPIVKYTSADSIAGRTISRLEPYGFPRFGQAGLELRMLYDSREDRASNDADVLSGITDKTENRNGFVLEANASAYPALWDAKSPFQSVNAVATAYLTLPVLTDPVLAFRAGGAKVFGRFPYTESAFLGGSQSLRTARRQRFAGDASVYGSTELRLPVAEFAFVFPLNVGLLGFGDIGRVYMDGDSPGGWHKGAGAGFWLGLLKSETNVNVLFTNSKERRVVIGLGFDY